MREINFMRWRRHFLLLSGILLLVSVGSLASRGLAFGLDFTGGLSVELYFASPPNLGQVRSALEEGGFSGAQVSYFGADELVLVRLPPLDDLSADAPQLVLQALQGLEAGAEIRRSESVGPRIGDELREQGGLAVLVALFGILMYIAFRFQSKFAVAAVAALAHDVLLVLGLFSLLGLDFDLAVLAAVFALIGYSLNDTIVVSDRIRENFSKLRAREPTRIINISLTMTLARTLVTSLTTLLVVLCLLFLGGGALRGFSLALALGVVVGTYSSIYILASVLLALRLKPADMITERPEEVV